MAKKKLTFQESFARLEEISGKMENIDYSFEEMMEMYKEGADLAKSLWQRLQKAEQEVLILQKTTEGMFTEQRFQKEIGSVNNTSYKNNSNNTIKADHDGDSYEYF